MLPKTHLGTPEYDRGTVGRARYGLLRLSTSKYADLTAAWKSCHGLEMFHHSDARSCVAYIPTTRDPGMFMLFMFTFSEVLIGDMYRVAS